MRKDFHQEDGHFSDLDQRRRAILLMVANRKENETVAELMMINLAKVDT